MAKISGHYPYPGRFGSTLFFIRVFIEPYRPSVEKVDILTAKLKKTNLRIVQISDLHCDQKERSESKVVEIINALKPDVIIFTGDAINAPEALPVFKKTMLKLKAGLGKFAVRGNWDARYWSNLDLFGGTGFRILNNENVKLTKEGEEFYLCGLDYLSPQNGPGLLEAVPTAQLRIFLYHTPDLIAAIEAAGADLYLAGHTHGGQIRLPVYGAIVTFSRYGKKYESGRHQVGKTILYVNRGIGMEGGIMPPVRFFCPPEITVLEIKPQ